MIRTALMTAAVGVLSLGGCATPARHASIASDPACGHLEREVCRLGLMLDEEDRTLGVKSAKRVPGSVS